MDNFDPAVEQACRARHGLSDPSPTASERERAVPTFEIRERAIAAMEAEMTRLIGSDDLEPERLGDETPEHFVARRCFEVMAKTTELGLMGYVECGAATASGPCVRERDHNPPHQSHIIFIAYPDERVRADHTEASSGERKPDPPFATLDAQLMECEEALRAMQQEYVEFRERMLRPIKGVEGESVESMSWDDLLGVAVRNLNHALDLEARLDALTRDHPEAQPRGDEERVARDFLAAVAAPAGRLSLTNPPPTPDEVRRDADLIVRACRNARDALDGTPFAALASSEAQPHGDTCEVCGRGEGYGWHVDPEVWDAVQSGYRGVVCPICFARKAEAAGIEMAVVGLTAADYRRWVGRDDEGNPLPPAWPDEHWSDAQPGEPTEKEVDAAALALAKRYARAALASSESQPSEPTEAEVEAAAKALYEARRPRLERANPSSVFQRWDDLQSESMRDTTISDARIALAAARSTRGEGGDG